MWEHFFNTFKAYFLTIRLITTLVYIQIIQVTITIFVIIIYSQTLNDKIKDVSSIRQSNDKIYHINITIFIKKILVYYKS